MTSILSQVRHMVKTGSTEARFEWVKVSVSGVYLTVVREGAGADVGVACSLTRRAGKGVRPEMKACLGSLALPIGGVDPQAFSKAEEVEASE